MDLFKKAFSIVLEQDNDVEDVAEPGAAAATPANDKEAMAQKLDTAKPEDFSVKGGITNVDAIKAKQKGKLSEWIGQIDEFIEYLNGTNDASIQSQLHAAQCETIFQDIARSEKKKIARLAAELSSLSESFKGYLISSND
jgi:hypothetical protein